MERVHLGEVVQEQAEVQEWVGLAGEEWAAQEPVQVPAESVSALSAGRSSPMKQAFPVTTKIVLNVGQQ
jgi:hypothetical protein